jgi:hypothetical protein
MTSGFLQLESTIQLTQVAKTTCHLQQHFFHIFEPNRKISFISPPLLSAIRINKPARLCCNRETCVLNNTGLITDEISGLTVIK